MITFFYIYVTIKKEMCGITERLYGVVKEVYIPLEYSGYFGTTLGSKWNNNKNLNQLLLVL